MVDIGVTDDASKGQMLSWDTLKTIKMKAYKYNSSSYQLKFGIHNANEFVPPTLEIRSIGDGPGIVPSTGMNIVQSFYTVYKNPSITGATILHYEWQEMRLVIKPTATDSVIELKYNLFGDFHNDLGF